MPDRIIKESICYSEDIDQLTPFEETVFYRLTVNADDYGRLDARYGFLRSRLFVTKKGVTEQNIKDAILKLASVGLIQIYEVDGKSFLLFPKWDKHQRIRAKRSKYPAPDSKILTPDNICRHLTAYDDICVRNPIQFESNSNLNPNPIQEVVAAAPSSSLSENENSEKEWHVDNQLLKTILEKTEIPFSARKTWFAEVDLIIYEDKIKIVPRGEFGSYVAGQINNVFLDKLKTAFLAEGYKQEIICEVET